jgi:hypothetical protein
MLLCAHAHITRCSALRVVAVVWGLSADTSSGISKFIYPFDWTSTAGTPPGTFNYTMTLTTSVAISLHVNGWIAGQPASVTLAAAPVANASTSVASNASVTSQFSFLQLPAVRQVGQAVTVQLTSNATSFAALHANNTGWRVQVLRPDNTLSEPALLQDGVVMPGSAGPTYQWTLNITGDKLTQVISACAYSLICTVPVNASSPNALLRVQCRTLIAAN